MSGTGPPALVPVRYGAIDLYCGPIHVRLAKAGLSTQSHAECDRAAWQRRVALINCPGR